MLSVYQGTGVLCMSDIFQQKHFRKKVSKKPPKGQAVLLGL